ncbi:MAG: sensor histidine kinase [Anaerolineales bacterium]|nr:sensor histidine kinase [Anaerolineales bacterium]
MTEAAGRGVLAKIPVDLRWLLGLLTLVAVIMYAVGIATDPGLRQPLPLVALTVLLATHLLLHWLLVKLALRPAWLTAYFIAQGLLFFAICLVSRSPNMIFPLFAGLLGEAVGSLGLNRRGVLAILYVVLILVISIFLLFERSVSGWMIVGTMAIVVSAVLYTTLYKRQVESRTEAQTLLQDLEVAHRRLGEYAARVEELTTAAERQRMARELHDTLSQGLAGLTLQLEAVEAHLAGGRPERALEIVLQARGRAREALAGSRRAIDDLRRSDSPDLGEAIHQEAEHFSLSTGIPCRVAVALPGAMPGALVETVLRVVAEGLTNVARHAQAKNVVLRIAITDPQDALSIMITDDGIGFDPDLVAAGHYGLLGMGERVRLVGGGFEIHSAPGRGTQLVIRLPLETSADE